MTKHGGAWMAGTAGLAGLLLILGGCAAPPQEPGAPLPGKATIAEAVAALDARRAALIPLRAGGQCRIKWWDDEDKVHEESCSIELRVCPPQRVFLVGSGLLGEMIRLGADENAFYLRVKPKEVSAYWGGRRDQLAACGQTLWINPDNLLEALGVVRVDRSWILQHENGTDILTRLSPDGRLAKQIRIDCGGYRVRRIDYHAPGGALAATIEMNDYEAIEGGVVVPTRLEMTVYRSEGKHAVVTLDLSGVRRFEPTDAQKEKLFRPADTRGFKHVYRLDEHCRFVPQPTADEE